MVKILKIFFIAITLVNFISCEISEDRLFYLLKHPATSSFEKLLIKKYIQKKRMNQCLKYFYSTAICGNNTNTMWFMWAQIVARNILTG